jgi:hypothetical protein
VSTAIQDNRADGPGGTLLLRVGSRDDPDRILRSLGEQGAGGVVLVVGGIGTPMTGVVDLKRLARELRERPRPFTLVSTDRIVRAAARGEGLHAVPSLDGRGHLRRLLEFPARASLRTARRVAGYGVPVDQATPVAKLWDALLGPLLLLGLIGVLVGAFLVVLYPSVDVVLRLASARPAVRIKAVAEPALNLVDVARGRVPARIVDAEVTGSRRAAATGRRTVAVSRATGQVKLTNLTVGAIYLPEGSIVATPDDRRYVTVVDVTVPGTRGAGEDLEPGELTVAVAAEAGGAAGNLGSGNIDRMDGPLMFSLDVEQPGAIAGGADRESVFVTEADRRALRDDLLNDLTGEAAAELAATVQEGEILRVWPLGAQNPTIVEASFDAAADQEVTEFGLDLRVRYFGTVFLEEDLRELVRGTLVGDVPGVEPEFELVGDSLVVSAPEVGGVISGAVAVTVEGSGVLRRRIDVNEIRDALLDVPLGEADAYLRGLEGVAAYDLRFWPGHSERTTRLTFRVNVRIDRSSPFVGAP